MVKNKYLEKAERHLKELDIPISARLRVMAELESRVDESPELLEKPPIETVNRFLLEMDIAIPRKKTSGWSVFLKFIFASFVLFGILLGVAYYKFSPVVQITEDRILILGGLIDLDLGSGTMKVDSHYSSNLGDQQVFKGSSNTINKLSMDIKNAQIQLSCSSNTTFKWNCKSTEPITSKYVNEENGILHFNMKEIKALECQFSIPHKKDFELDADNINIAIDKACFNVDIDAKNGSVIILENPELNYKYDLKVNKGFIENFTSVDIFDHKIQIEIDNGTINKKL